MEQISFQDFAKVEIRIGTVIDVQDFSEAKNPSYKLWVDFWEFGIKKTSAQITKLYQKEELIGRQIIWVINLEPKQIGKFVSDFLLTWFRWWENGEIVLASSETKVKNGERLI